MEILNHFDYLGSSFRINKDKLKDKIIMEMVKKILNYENINIYMALLYQ